MNEKFSGLTMEEMTGATKDLPEVRREMCRLIDENTIIIGHGYVTGRRPSCIVSSLIATSSL